jgi:sulfite exporter TauE/SafE
VLAAFWSGSLPILLGIGVGVQSVSARVSRHVPLVTASVLLVMGLVAVTGRVNAPALALDAINPPNGAASCH